MPKTNPSSEINKQLTLTIKKDKSYLAGLASALSLVIFLAAATGYFAYTTFQKASTLFDAVDETIVEKIGLQITQIGSQPLEQASKIAQMKNFQYQLPDKIRNIFSYGVYFQTVAPAPTSTATSSSRQ